MSIERDQPVRNKGIVMDEEERQKLSAYRKKRQKEKELEKSLHKNIKSQALKNRIRSIRESNENKFTGGLIIFLGTLLPLYLFIFGSYFLFQIFFGAPLAMVGISLNWLPPFLHGSIWVVSLLSVCRNKSLLDNLINRFA